jgi:hypothetical protein
MGTTSRKASRGAIAMTMKQQMLNGAFITRRKYKSDRVRAKLGYPSLWQSWNIYRVVGIGMCEEVCN